MQTEVATNRQNLARQEGWHKECPPGNWLVFNSYRNELKTSQNVLLHQPHQNSWQLDFGLLNSAYCPHATYWAELSDRWNCENRCEGFGRIKVASCPDSKMNIDRIRANHVNRTTCTTWPDVASAPRGRSRKWGRRCGRLSPPVAHPKSGPSQHNKLGNRGKRWI